jgi:hypothetical protein
VCGGALHCAPHISLLFRRAGKGRKFLFPNKGPPKNAEQDQGS